MAKRKRIDVKQSGVPSIVAHSWTEDKLPNQNARNESRLVSSVTELRALPRTTQCILFQWKTLEQTRALNSAEITKWVSKLPADVSVDVRNALAAELGEVADEYIRFASTNDVANREVARILKVLRGLEGSPCNPRLIEAIRQHAGVVAEFMTSSTQSVARKQHPRVDVLEEHPVLWRVKIADIAFRNAYRELTEAGLPANEAEHLAKLAVKAIGHKAKYRPPREGAESSSRAQQGRRKAEPKPDPTLGYLVAVRAVWPQVEDVRAGRSPEKAAEIASRIRTALPQIPEREILKRIRHVGVTQQSFARFLKARSMALPAMPKS